MNGEEYTRSRAAHHAASRFVSGDIDSGDFKGAIQNLEDLREGVRWVQGDLINDAKTRYGITGAYKLAAEALGSTIRWTLELSRVADIFPSHLRRAGVSWNVYRACASMHDPYAALDVALGERLTGDEVRERFRTVRDPAIATT